MSRLRLVPVVLSALLLAQTFAHPGLAQAGKPTAAQPPGASYAFPIVRIGDPRLPHHTVLRAKNLRAVPFRMPVVAWANGACAMNNKEANGFLRKLASFGFFVLANGDPTNKETGSSAPSDLTASISFAVSENGRRGSPYFGRIDTDRIAVMGQSCGGWDAGTASSDPRVKSTLIWNSFVYPQDQPGLHAPILMVSGWWPTNAVAAFQANPISVEPSAAAGGLATFAATVQPTVFAAHDSAGHSGFWEVRDDPTWRPEAAVVAEKWLRLSLYGTADGRAFFLPPECKLCTRDHWAQVLSKGWEQFTPPGG